MFGVDRTSNRAWKRRRNWLWVVTWIRNANGYGSERIVTRVMETRPGLDRGKVREMVRGILKSDPAEEIPKRLDLTWLDD